MARTCSELKKMVSLLQELEAPAKMRDLHIYKFPRMRTLFLQKNSLISNMGIKELPLTSLHLSWSSKITDEGICGLPLTHLHLSYNAKITDAGIKGLPLTHNF
eukprot:TRINITY_DN2288_c0_g1_i1.p1 TRINITY_DN2288_c0_g1~~TRINITY_DN2288_c0_g1_i1.p1  ORF type:complete len:103 (-),score=11.90 TRINITY_DN2288_c0_g1_i1:81-389(-)